MLSVGYHASFGLLRASHQTTPGSMRLTALRTDLDMDGAGGHCELTLELPVGISPAPADVLTVELDGGIGSARVFTGTVRRVHQSERGCRIVGVDGLSELARLQLARSYGGISAGAIVKDLLAEVGLEAGEIEDGPTFPQYALHIGQRALHHLQALARRCGSDVYGDADGRIHFTAPSRKVSPKHLFRYGADILSLDLQSAPAGFDGVEVIGEGVSSMHGRKSAHWLSADLSLVRASARVGPLGLVVPGARCERPQVIHDGTIRSLRAAMRSAEVRAHAMAMRPLRGSVVVVGCPAVQPGDTIALTELPPTSFAAQLVSMLTVPLRVRRVVHRLDVRRGFTTRLGF